MFNNLKFIYSICKGFILKIFKIKLSKGIRIFLVLVLITIVLCPFVRKLLVCLITDFFGSIISFLYFILSIFQTTILVNILSFLTVLNVHISAFYKLALTLFLKLYTTQIITVIYRNMLCFFNDFWSLIINFINHFVGINFINSFLKSSFRCFGKYYKFMWFLIFITIFLIVELQKNFFF